MKQLFGRRRDALHPEKAARPKNRAAQVYLRGDKYFVATSSQTRDGFWMADGSVAVIGKGDAAGLNRAVRFALQRSKGGIQAPKDWSAWKNPVLEAAGYKRFSAFEKGALLVGIDEKADRISFMPYENLGKEGFHGRVELAFEGPADSPDLTPSIEIAFENCR